MNKIAILGFPVKHSLSPKMHNYWLKTMKIKGEYKTIETNKNNLKKTVKKLCQQKYVGLNLTIPLKEEVVKFLNKKDKVVNTIGAVNTLIFLLIGFPLALLNATICPQCHTASSIGPFNWFQNGNSVVLESLKKIILNS